MLWDNLSLKRAKKQRETKQPKGTEHRTGEPGNPDKKTTKGNPSEEAATKAQGTGTPGEPRGTTSLPRGTDTTPRHRALLHKNKLNRWPHGARDVGMHAGRAPSSQRLNYGLFIPEVANNNAHLKNIPIYSDVRSCLCFAGYSAYHYISVNIKMGALFANTVLPISTMHQCIIFLIHDHL